MFSRWRATRDLAHSRLRIDYFELVGGNVLLIIGSIVLGIGIASFENMAAGLALSISGGVMLFAGILLAVRTFVSISLALENAVKAVEKVADYTEEVEKKTFGISGRRYSSYDSLQKEVEKLKKKIEALKSVLRENNIKIGFGSGL